MSGSVSRSWNRRRCWTRWSLRRNARAEPSFSWQALCLCCSKWSSVGSSVLQYAQWLLPVELMKTEPPCGVHCHSSMLRWRDFSCRAQSYLCLNVSQQKVHLKMRSVDFVSAFFFGRLFGCCVDRVLVCEDSLDDRKDCSDEELGALSMLVIDEGPLYPLNVPVG